MLCQKKKKKKKTIFLCLDPDGCNNTILRYQRCFCFYIQLSRFSQHYSAMASFHEKDLAGSIRRAFQGNIQGDEAVVWITQLCPWPHSFLVGILLNSQHHWSLDVHSTGPISFQDCYNHGFLNPLLVSFFSSL